MSDERMRAMRLVVTGGAGFIGSNFVRYWLERNQEDEVINLDALTYAGDPHSLDDLAARHGARYRFVRGDIADRALVRRVLDETRPDLVVNFAAESHNSRAVVDPAAFVQTNVVGTQVLLGESRASGVPRLHHISTCEVYGDLPLDSPESFTERSPYRPRTPYSASKAAADLLVRAYHETFGMNVTISNCSNNYGPRQHPEKVIPLFVTNALDDLPLPLYRRSSHRREWLHVDDHCHAIDLVVRQGRPGETYNVGSGDERSVEEIADAVLRLVGKSATLKRYVDDRPGHDRRYLLDHVKISQELGWRPRIGFEDGLRATVDWYRANRDWWAAKKTGTTAPDEFSWHLPARATVPERR